MTGPVVVGAEHLSAAVDAVLGLDPSQAPQTVQGLAERLSVPQPSLAEALQALESTMASEHLRRALPLVFCMVEAAARAKPDLGEIPGKLFATSLMASTGDARRLAAEGPGSAVALRERQPELTAFVDRHLAAPDSFAAKLKLDDRLGMIAMGLGTVRAVDRQLQGAEQPVRSAAVPGRNDPCPCGSGRKYKKCHGAAA